MTPYTSARERIRAYTPPRFARPSSTSSIPVPAIPHSPPPTDDSQPSNVVLFGETGTGKSSVVNLITGSKLAETSPDAGACTFASNPYHIVLQSNRPFWVWDTIGLNEPEISRTDYLRAIQQAYKLIKRLERSGGVHLLLLCMRGRITRSVQQNYNLFVKILCEMEVPLGVVVTNLENERCMEEWWTANKEAFDNYGISTDGHACITASPGLENVFLGRYMESREKTRTLLLELTLPGGKGWRMEKRRWLVNLLGKLARMLPQRRGTRQYPTHKELVEKLVRECRFPKDDAKSIAASIIEVRDQIPDSD